MDHETMESRGLTNQRLLPENGNMRELTIQLSGDRTMPIRVSGSMLGFQFKNLVAQQTGFDANSLFIQWGNKQIGWHNTLDSFEQPDYKIMVVFGRGL